MALILIIFIIRMYFLTNFIMFPCSEYTNAHAQLIPRGLINENGVRFEIKSL